MEHIILINSEINNETRIAVFNPEVNRYEVIGSAWNLDIANQMVQAANRDSASGYFAAPGGGIINSSVTRFDPPILFDNATDSDTLEP